MTGEDADRFAEGARLALGLPSDVPARGWIVWRPSSQVASHYLIEFGEPQAVIAVAAVDAETGELQSSARLPGSGQHMVVSDRDALALARLPDGRARLVWSPSRQTASPLYPIWEVLPAEEMGDAVYVDMSGRVWPRLEPGGPGG